MTYSPGGVYRVGSWDTPEHLAERFTGDAGRGWELAEYNPAFPWLWHCPYPQPTPLHPVATDLILPPLWRGTFDRSGELGRYFPADQGARYRGRLLLRGLASIASEDRIKAELEKQGFGQIVIYPPESLPADWPPDERQALGGIAKKTIFVEGTWTPPSQLADLQSDDRVTFLGAWRFQAPPGQAQASPPGQAPPAGQTTSSTPPPPAAQQPAGQPILRAPGEDRDQWARRVVLAGYARAMPGFVGTLGELQAEQGICAFDGAYGQWRESAAAGAHNWGAIHRGFPDKETGQCGVDSFLRDDYDAVTGKRYAVCFKRYASDEDGAADVVRHTHAPTRPLTGAALPSGDLAQIMACMYDERYFRGFSTNREREILSYAQAVMKHCERIAKACGEPLQVKIGIIPPKRGKGPPAPMRGTPLPAGNSRPPAPLAGRTVAIVAVVGIVGVGGWLMWRKHKENQALARLPAGPSAYELEEGPSA